MFFSDEDLLALSGIQHFAFCPRQWALIHIEGQWVDNVATVQGKHLHERVDDPSFFESRGDVLVTRSVPLSSHVLGLYGVADMVEFHFDNVAGVPLPARSGIWNPVPVEYKRGKPKGDSIDQVQLCAQAMCLEEMLKLVIPFGYIFYGTVRRRTKVVFNSVLRDEVVALTNQMHKVLTQGITPAPSKGRNCKECSMVDVCLPMLNPQNTVRAYISKYLRM